MKYPFDQTEIITASLLVETRLGTFTGRQKADQYFKRADARNDWAYRELKALIKYTDRDNFDVFDIESSYAGAAGFARFMQLNILIRTRKSV